MLALLLDAVPPLPVAPPEAPPLAAVLPPLDPDETPLLDPPSLLEPPFDELPGELEPPLLDERLESAELPPLDEETPPWLLLVPPLPPRLPLELEDD